MLLNLYCTIVQEKFIYQYILPDFSFDYCSEKMTLKTPPGPTTSRENAIRKYQIRKFPPYEFSNFSVIMT